MGEISKTKLFDSLGSKLGRETTDDLIGYFENKIDKDLESKLSIFATKEDLAKGLANLESKISESRIEAKDMFTNLESKMSEWRLETKDMFAKLESKMSEWRIETKDGYTKLDAKIDESEKRVLEKTHQSEINIIKEIYASERETLKEIHQFKEEKIAKLGQYKVDILIWIVSLILSVSGLLYSILK